MPDPSNLDIVEIDAASNNGVDEMRDLREKVQYPPVAGKYKVYIVDEVHMLSTGAFNALLKTLEEPPAHAVFILATTEAQKIPATILSRCMRFDFKLIPQADLENRLRQVLNEIGKPYEEEAVAAIARAGAGSVRDMLSLADTCVSYSAGKLTYADVTSVLGGAGFAETGALCAAVLSGDPGEAFSRTEEVLSGGKSVGMLLKDVMNYLNACAVAKMCRDAEKILSLPPDVFGAVAKLAAETDGHRLLRATEIFADTENALRYSVSPRIVFETAVMKAAMPAADYDIESLLSRISALEKRLEGGVPAPAARKSEPVSAAPNPGRSFGRNPPHLLRRRKIASLTTKPRPPTRRKRAAASISTPAFCPSRPFLPRRQGRRKGTRGSGNVKGRRRRQRPRRRPPGQGPAVRANAVPGDAKATFGSFLRALRKTAKNGVLFTLCMDLDCAYEDGKFVLYTESETIYASLSRPDHRGLVESALEAIGLSDFDIRLRGKKKDDFNKSLSELKEKFPGVKIEVD